MDKGTKVRMNLAHVFILLFNHLLIQQTLSTFYIHDNLLGDKLLAKLT